MNKQQNIVINQNLKLLDVLPISLKYHLRYLYFLSGVIIIYHIVNTVLSYASFNSLLPQIAGGILASILFYFILSLTISMYIIKHNKSVIIYNDRIEAQLFSKKKTINLSEYKRSYNMELTKNLIVFLSNLPSKYRGTSRLISDSVFIFAPEGSEIRDTIMTSLQSH